MFFDARSGWKAKSFDGAKIVKIASLFAHLDSLFCRFGWVEFIRSFTGCIAGVVLRLGYGEF